MIEMNNRSRRKNKKERGGEMKAETRRIKEREEREEKQEKGE